MKYLKYTFCSLLLLVVMASCKKEPKADVDDNFHPRIIDNGGVFTTPNRMIFQGQSAIYNGLTFSPKPIEKSKISWKVNDEVVSTDTAFTFTPTAGGEYVIKVEATYNGQTSTRISTVLVSPDTYTPKAFTNVALAYLTENATVASVDFSKVTHIAYTGARVTPSGAVDFSRGNLNQNLDVMVARAHNNGVPVLLGVTGTLSGVDGWSTYGSADFGSVLINPTLRAALSASIIEYITAHRLDGVDVLMTDIGNDSEAVSASHMQAITPFLALLKAALPGKTFTVTVTTNYLHWNYGDLSAADWVNVHAFEDGVHVGPDAPRGQPSSLAFMTAGANIWAAKLPKSKLVVGIPAFGLRYNAINEAGNNASWGSYDYVTYKDILGIDATAFGKEMINSAEGIYFNGIPLVDQKTEYLKANGFKGAYLYAGDYDVIGTNSLMAAVYSTLN